MSRSEIAEAPHTAVDAGRQRVQVGGAPLGWNGAPVNGDVVEIDGVSFYRIESVDRMDPFFVTVVSSGDHWLFASSTGALTAGRGAPEHALFPYETVDRIHDAQDRTGGKTLLLIRPEGDAGETLWEPFSDRYAGLAPIRRSLAKSLAGDRLRYEETHDTLGLTFSQTWSASRRYGFVRTSELRNESGESVQVRLLDGVQNLMPYGIERAMQERQSVLANAYKRSERLDSGLGIFALSAIPVDRAEPSEALLATTVWQAGLETDTVLLSSRQLGAFRRGEAVRDERLVRAERGAYLTHAQLALTPGEARTWDLVADIEQDAAAVVALDETLRDADALRQRVHGDVAEGAERLAFLIATADGEQASADAMATARHRMNVLYNIMRGGLFDEGYTVRREGLRAFVRHFNTPVAEAHADWFDALPESLPIQDLRQRAEQGSAHLQRLVEQYLPLHFSRRHGDPSRPWNHFSIDVRDAEGQTVHGYEGNWRDIFQNWEALSRSFPGYLDAMVSVFVSASTADGYNPYRITDGGIDWEVSDPDDPWSYIGYWGDHQIIYLLRLLAQLQAHAPDRLAALLGERRFSYANVPYRIAPYADILRDPQDTVAYDEAEAARIEARVEAIGADGTLLVDASGEVRLVTLAEKLLVPVLAKLTNFVPAGGIWMNTQRPEWNDANNALVGNGISVVTLFAVRRYLAFLRDVLGIAEATLSVEVADLLAEVTGVFEAHDVLASRPLSDAERRAVVDALGEAGSRYRATLYGSGLSGETRDVPAGDVRMLIDRALAAIDQSLAENRRDDGLVHSYNLLEIASGGMGVRYLYPMLEGQVAALDAGVLPHDEAVRLLRALRESDIYRADQHSYRLYPDRSLPGFLEKNTLPADALDRAPLLATLLDDGDTRLIARDVRGDLHFHGAFRNADDVRAALDRLADDGRDLSDDDRQRVLDVFEAVFDHRAFTGRSGTFFGYEGLGSIYWHMVSKLALATQETVFRAAAVRAEATADLADAYYDVRAGLGGSKTPDEFGAFPTDAYSHTPGHAGAKQPGLTGQVKEDALCRWGELGVLVQDGCIVFRPLLLRAEEFVSEPISFAFVDVHDQHQSLDLDAGQLAFTLCATPVVYRSAHTLSVRVVASDGAVTAVDGDALPSDLSAEVFGRTGAVARIEVDIPPGR
ncbi:MAG: hypothetical protein AAGK21_02150 [Bacteroidota bacterium]